MHKHIAMDWADALESGDFIQGFYGLHSTETGIDVFCGIGVLTYLAYKAGIIERSPYSTKYTSGFVYDGDRFAPSAAVMQWAGLQYGSDVQIPSLHSSIMGMNDTERMSFGYLGSIVRECWEEM